MVQNGGYTFTIKLPHAPAAGHHVTRDVARDHGDAMATGESNRNRDIVRQGGVRRKMKTLDEFSLKPPTSPFISPQSSRASTPDPIKPKFVISDLVAQRFARLTKVSTAYPMLLKLMATTHRSSLQFVKCF